MYENVSFKPARESVNQIQRLSEELVTLLTALSTFYERIKSPGKHIELRAGHMAQYLTDNEYTKGNSMHNKGIDQFMLDPSPTNFWAGENLTDSGDAAANIESDNLQVWLSLCKKTQEKIEEIKTGVTEIKDPNKT